MACVGGRRGSRRRGRRLVGAAGVHVVDGLAVPVFFYLAAGHEVVEQRLQAEDRYQVVAVELEPLLGPLLSVQQHDDVLHLQTGEAKEGRRLYDVAAAGGEVVQEEDGLASVVDAFQEGRGGITFLGRVDVDHGGVGDERKGGGQVEPTEGDACHPVEGRNVRAPHALEAAYLTVHEARGSPQGAWLADERADVDVGGRGGGGAGQGG